MHRLLLLICLGASISLHAQCNLAGSDYCAQNRKLLAPAPPAAPDFRSDSIDLLHTDIQIDITAAPVITASTTIDFQLLINNTHNLLLDLEGLTATTVKLDNSPVPFTQSNSQINVPLPANLGTGGTHHIYVQYSGTPVTDATGWGGFYNQSGYTYVLGVGFAADPHSFGRAWFPCFDNFVERCSFTIAVTSPASKPAYCNGTLLSDVPDANGNHTRKWNLDEQIPSYLACFAAGPYVSWTRNINNIPIEIAAPAADTNKVRNSFIHLKEAIDCYQHWYGPYKWPKIGYSLVPFNSGAMEHATNISIMRVAIDGSLNYETLWAHEFSHHWWGDLATCSTASDMWLNEGWASFSEHLFTEWVYGKAAYISAVRDNHLNILQNAHVEEGGYLAVSGVSQDLTYGTHVYKKGAVVAHNLRGYMGDSLFQLGIKSALTQTNFSDWSSAEFRDKLNAATGLDLTDFFNDWVFNGGYSHFEIDSTQVQSGVAGYTATVYVKQKLRGAPHLHQHVPLEFAFVGPGHQVEYRQGVCSGANTVLNFNLPFSPVYSWVNTRQTLNLARADFQKNITSTGNVNCAPAKLDFQVNTLPDSALLRVEYSFAMPDTGDVANPLHYTLSNRYWTIYGDFPAGFDASGKIFYDGRGQMDQLDAELFAQTSPSEDSVRLLYRSKPGEPWFEWPSYTKNTLGSTTNKYGLILINHMVPGQYTIAKGISTVPATEPARSLIFLKLSPNPADSTVKVKADDSFDTVQVYNMNGVIVLEQKVSNNKSCTLQTGELAAGQYRVVVSGRNKIGVAALMVQH